VLRSYGNKIYTHVELKRLYRYFVVRKYLLSLNTSGLYCLSDIKQCAKTTGISYTTLRDDLKWFNGHELVTIVKKRFRINTLPTRLNSILRLFNNNERLLQESKTPAITFSDLYKNSIIKKNVTTQVYKVCKDPKIAKKTSRQIRRAKTRIGLKGDGIYLSHKTIGNLFGRSRYTACRYIKRMHDTNIINKKRESKRLGTIKDYPEIRTTEGLYGRVFIKRGIVYERLQNSYLFIN